MTTSTHHLEMKKAIEQFAASVIDFLIVCQGTEPAKAEKEKRPRGRPRKTPPAPPTPAEATAAPAEVNQATPQKDPVLSDVMAVFHRVIDEFDDQGATDILADFGVQRVRELRPDQFGPAIAAAEKYLKEDETDDGRVQQ